MTANKFEQVQKDIDQAFGPGKDVQHPDLSGVLKDLDKLKNDPAFEQYKNQTSTELAKHGFKDIVIVDSSKLLQTDGKGHAVHVLDDHMNVVDAKFSALLKSAPGSGPKEVDQKESLEFWAKHERKDNADGSKEITVQKGDHLWRYATKEAEERFHRRMDPNNPQDMRLVYQLTKEIAAKNHITIENGKAMIKPGDHISIPSEKESKVKDYQQPPAEKQKEAPKDAPKEDPRVTHPDKNTTVVTDDTGGKVTVKTDDQGNPIEITREGGHWKRDNREGRYTKTGEHEWTDNKGNKWNGDVDKIGANGDYSYTDAKSHHKYTYHADGSYVETDEKNRPISVMRPNGTEYRLSYEGDSDKPNDIRSNDGKLHYHKDGTGWHKDGSKDVIEDVVIDGNGKITEKYPNGFQKEFFKDGSQRDSYTRDGLTFITFVQTTDGHSYLMKYQDSEKIAFSIEDRANHKTYERNADGSYGEVHTDRNGRKTVTGHYKPVMKGNEIVFEDLDKK